MAIFGEFLAPVLFLRIAAAIDELLVIAVGDLEAIDKILRQIVRSNPPDKLCVSYGILCWQPQAPCRAASSTIR